MQEITRTIYANYLQTCLFTGKPFQLFENSTLNEKLGINPGITPVEVPTLKYFAIGNGGHDFNTGSNGVPMATMKPHRGDDAALASQLPFVLRELSNDLTIVERANYALRRVETHDGVEYAAYYLKRLPMDNLTPTMEHVTVEDGEKTVTPFVPSSSNLNPVLSVLSNGGQNVVAGEYLNAASRFDTILDNNDINEIRDAAAIIFGDPNAAIISEVALCAGEDKNVSAVGDGNSTFTFLDAVSVQVMSFISSFYVLQAHTESVTVALDVGASESVFRII